MVCAARPPRSRRSATPERRRPPAAQFPTPDPETQAEKRPPLTFGQHAWAFAKELTAVVIGAIIVASLLRGFVGQMFIIPSASMLNTLQLQDRVAVAKIGSIKRGQVVVFEDPGRWLGSTAPVQRGPIERALEFVGVLPDTGTEHLIKRVVGLPGDHVVCCDAQNRITVNDQPLDERSYLYTDAAGQQSAPSAIRFDVIVPAQRMFVLGDNRSNSRDSRCHLRDSDSGTVRGENAFVSLDLVVGHAVAVVWPVGHWARLSIPDTYGAIPVAGPAPAQAVVHAGPEASC